MRASELATTLLGLAAAIGVATAGAHAQSPRSGPRADVEVIAPASLAAPGPAEVVVLVRVRPASRRPVLVTPSSEGDAIEIVRGRLLRADAESPEAETLRFRVPIVARTAGTAIFRVQVVGYTCTGRGHRERCRAVHGAASAVLRVSARAR